MLQTTHHRGSSNYTFHVKWTHNKTEALGSSQGNCGSGEGFSSVESSWKLYPRPPVRKPIFVWARSTCCAVIPAHDVTPLEITLPFELTTQSELFSAPDISFLLWRTAKQPFFSSFKLQLFRDPLYHLPNINRCMDHVMWGPPENWHKSAK